LHPGRRPPAIVTHRHFGTRAHRLTPIKFDDPAYQPFTPAIETLRGLLLGGQIGHNGWLATAWCLGLTVLGYLWSTAKFNRDPR
jgi:hypothetical protein